MNIQLLKDSARKLGIDLNDQMISQFELYLKELTKWNEQINLTSITDQDEIVLKHFVDSLTVIPEIPKNAKKVIDVGSGAGFPGIPVKIVRPDLEVHLLEATEKKGNFLSHISHELNFDKFRVMTGRAEDLAKMSGYRESYDVVFARAVAQLDTLVEYTLPFLSVGGVFIAQKKVGEAEIYSANEAIAILGGKLKTIAPINISGLDDRQLVVIEKIRPTEIKYPRRVGVPSKRPL